MRQLPPTNHRLKPETNGLSETVTVSGVRVGTGSASGKGGGHPRWVCEQRSLGRPLVRVRVRVEMEVRLEVPVRVEWSATAALMMVVAVALMAATAAAESGEVLIRRRRKTVARSSGGNSDGGGS